MLPEKTRETIRRRIEESEYPRDAAVDVMYLLQKHYGYLTDDAVREGAAFLGMTPLELEELATFYDFIYRDPLGKYVIHVCDSTICWMEGHESVLAHLTRKLDIPVGGTTPDGLFSLLPVCCIGFCDQAPAMLVNGEPYGHLTSESIDRILETLRREQPVPDEVK
jgi:NADH-quinone oxidoreductase subunit E